MKLTCRRDMRLVGVIFRSYFVHSILENNHFILVISIFSWV